MSLDHLHGFGFLLLQNVLQQPPFSVVVLRCNLEEERVCFLSLVAFRYLKRHSDEGLVDLVDVHVRVSRLRFQGSAFELRLGLALAVRFLEVHLDRVQRRLFSLGVGSLDAVFLHSVLLFSLVLQDGSRSHVLLPEALTIPLLMVSCILPLEGLHPRAYSSMGSVSVAP